MLTCINKNSVEYQSLKDKASIPTVLLDAVSRTYLEKYSRFPYLDELPGSNSEPHLKDKLKVNKYGGVSIQRVLDTVQANTVEEANAVINNEYRDLETEIIPLNSEALVEITHRPTINPEAVSTEQDNIVDIGFILNRVVDKLSTLYGIQINTITQQELNQLDWPIPNGVKGFIHEGQIYINTDCASIDTPIHEIMHLFIGSIRFTDPVLYQNLLTSIQQLPNYDYLVSLYPNRTRNDVNEEILVTEVSKYMAEIPSAITNLNEDTKYEIMYNVGRMLDTILMGKDSAKTLTHPNNMSLRQIANTLSSDTFISKQGNGIEDSSLHRTLNNIKSQLYKNNELQEVCD